MEKRGEKQNIVGNFGSSRKKKDGAAWGLVGSNPHPLAGLSFLAYTLVAFRSTLYLMGGASQSAASSQVWASLDGQTWTLFAALPTARMSFAVATDFHSKLWMLGGAEYAWGMGGAFPRDVWFYGGCICCCVLLPLF